MPSYSYPRPALTTDCVVFALDRDEVNVLLIQRKLPPYEGQWAFPGGFVEEGESVEQCAARELQEETGLSQIALHQFHTFSAPGRDPRGWTVSVAFFAGVRRHQESCVRGGDDAAQARWFPLSQIPPLAFDHAQILDTALRQIRHRMVTEPLIFDLLNQIFTFDDVDTLFSHLFGPEKDAFEWLSRMQRTGLVRVHNEDIPSYTFHREAYEKAPDPSALRFD